MNRTITWILTLCFLVITGELSAQELSKKQINTIVDEVIAAVDENFIIPETKTTLINELKQLKKRGKYASLTDQSELARAITADLLRISGDKHMYLIEDRDENDANPQPQRRMVRMSAGEGMPKGLMKYEMLEGNIAYVDVSLFPPTQGNADEYEAILKHITKSDAIIFDVSKCRGGYGGGISLLIGGVIEEPTLLTTYYSKEGAGPMMSAKTEYGAINKDKDVYVLTSRNTGSAGEGFAFYPQQLGRVTVIGQTSAGAGRSNALFELSHGFILSVSTRTSITPNKKQFQGVGVEPDIYTPVAYAKSVAHMAALKTLKTKKPEKASEYEKLIRAISDKADSN